MPACLIEARGDAPVPPSWPLIWMASAPALATPVGDDADAGRGDQLDVDPRRGMERAQVENQLARDPRCCRCRGAPAARSASCPAARGAGARCAESPSSPGSWPPSPGFEPCAILICSSSAERRYAGVTPNRADATCLVRLPSSRRFRAREAVGLFAAFAAVAARAEPVHRDRDRAVRFRRQRADRHRRREEPAADRRRPARPRRAARRHGRAA